jgi:hypothetical protein
MASMFGRNGNGGFPATPEHPTSQGIAAITSSEKPFPACRNGFQWFLC